MEDTSIKQKTESSLYKKHSFKTLFQIQLMFFISNLVWQVFALMQFYYTTVLLLPIELFMISFLIFTVWNMFNDPILGHFSDKSTRWTTKWGKRFPFIVIGVVGTALSLILCFFVPIADPASNPILVFIWLLIAVNIFDTFYALFMVNSISLFQYKVRDDSDRRKSGALLMLTVGLGLLTAIILQPIIIESFGANTVYAWTMQAVVFGVITICILFLMGKGIRESDELKSHREMIDSRDKITFFKAMKTVLKSRSYDAALIAWLCYLITVAVATASLSFFVVYVLGLDLTATIFPMLIMLFMAPAVGPLWIKLGNKYGSKNIFILSYFIMMAAFFLFLFVTVYEMILVIMALFGAGLGAHGVMQHPIDADVIEEAAVNTGTRNEGVYNGIQTFFHELSYAGQVLIIGTVQILTGFDPLASTQTPLALLGLRLIVSVIPMIVLAIGVIFFWIFYDITPEKREQIQVKLKELNL